ncbi:RhoGAP-domain-containing protein [Sanghuangporus baumii]|uniref:RhoGAP-domain-containing protein n=1 Tax=Sanghuangporus baumii TaxID=108892 RepID=A0A9Q5HVX4_SANBA|nr:RhoGAP-domain-containing protein [Sanghuangporus baumii]
MLRDTATTHHHASDASQLPLASAPAQSSPPGFSFSSARRNTALDKSATAMGQAGSTAKPPELGAGVQAQVSMPPPPSPQPKSKSRFGWPGRRKKSEDFTKLMISPTPSPVPSLHSAPPPSSLNNTSKGRELARKDSNVSSVESNGGFNMHELSRPPSRTSSAKQLTLQFASNTLSALKGKLNASQASIHSFRNGGPMSPTILPPPLPPKPDISHLSTSSSRSEGSSGDWVALEKTSKPLPSPTPDASAPVTGGEARHPEMVPTATATGTPSSSSEHAHDVNVPLRRERERREGTDAQTAKEIADDWRKSDSTLRTVRLVGSRTPRPLSLAESTNSNHTVLPTVGAGSPAGNMNMGAGKRLSALMTDVDFGLKEVDSEDDDDEESAFPSSAFNSVHNLQEQQVIPFSSSAPTATSSKPQPTPRRGSLSIRIGRFSGSKTRVSEHGQLDGSDSEVLSSSVSTQGTGTDMGMFTANSSTTSVTSSSHGIGTKDSRPSIEIASSASIASSMSSEHHPDRYAQYKANSKLEPWISLPPAATDSQASLSTSESMPTSSRKGSPSRHTDTEMSGKHAVNMSPPHGANLRPAHQRSRLQSIQARGFRQTAVSLTTGLAPAAGFARKAVDRLGRALAGSSTSLANNDAEEVQIPHAGGHKHGHAPTASASSAALFGQHPHPHGHHHRHHHLPQHPPSSSKKAMRKHGASPSGTWSVNSTSTSDTDGGPAGPNLGPCLRGPLIPVNGNGKGLVFGRELELCVKDTACTGEVESGVDGLSLEGRSLPALVARCAQHIVKWGVQEEGLFRISGRSTHIAKLRAEFDSGADYDLRECGPGEIDPHAVSSIFKAYLRELPEPLLTRHLMPYFEVALTAENNMINAADAQSTGQNGNEHKRRSGLPSSPRDSVQVRKAPSLSTFAVPALAPRTASHTLTAALSELIARLPKENRDLLRTVTELIMATARASRETKMPLSNLLLVFCPSLMMGPPLLRALCEGKEIWDGPLEDVKIPPVLEALSSSETGNGEEEVKVGEDSGRSSGESETGLHHHGTIRRPPRASSEVASTKATSEEETVEMAETAVVPVAPLPSLVLPCNDEEASVTSRHTKTDSSISASINSSSPDGNNTHSSSSSESLHTPLSSSPASLSPNKSLAPSGSITKPALDTSGLSNKFIALRAQSGSPSPLSPSSVKKAVRKSLIGNPVPFPLGMNRNCSGSGSAGSAPVTPIELSSDKLLLTPHSSSSPNLTKVCASPSPASTPPRPGRRKSKASMLGLKSKRSLSSLLGLAQEQAHIQPVLPAVPNLAEEVNKESAHPPRSSTPCPVLELPVDTSGMRLGEGLGLGISLTDKPEQLKPVKSERMPEVPSTLRIPLCSRSPSPFPSQHRPQGSSPSPAMMMDRVESDSSAVTNNSVFYTPPTTTRALAPSADNSVSVSSSIAPTISTSSSNSGSYSFLDFNLGKAGGEDDWAKSVLQAASSDS